MSPERRPLLWVWHLPALHSRVDRRILKEGHVHSNGAPFIEQREEGCTSRARFGQRRRSTLTSNTRQPATQPDPEAPKGWRSSIIGFTPYE
ncbi:hypothetical protein M8818_002472 [Zalaria obscura]|uniref:Uncharacterized protein n=1 Tax=Zalaria obscura TaxID=2024903 RepID=A0ACC3SGL0_9PEZI